ncbi:hypothetical protein BJ912DRAFT_1142341, partial [Pholiota molesta]
MATPTMPTRSCPCTIATILPGPSAMRCAPNNLPHLCHQPRNVATTQHHPPRTRQPAHPDIATATSCSTYHQDPPKPYTYYDGRNLMRRRARGGDLDDVGAHFRSSRSWSSAQRAQSGHRAAPRQHGAAATTTPRTPEQGTTALGDENADSRRGFDANGSSRETLRDDAQLRTYGHRRSWSMGTQSTESAQLPDTMAAPRRSATRYTDTGASPATWRRHWDMDGRPTAWLGRQRLRPGHRSIVSNGSTTLGYERHGLDNNGRSREGQEHGAAARKCQWTTAVPPARHTNPT